MSEHKPSLIKYVKLHYHLHMAEGYIKKAERMLDQIAKLKQEAEKHNKRAKELYEEVKL